MSNPSFNKLLHEGLKSPRSCPFCGGKAIVFQIPENTEEELRLHPDWNWRNPGRWIIGCDTPQCFGNYNHVIMTFADKRDAVNAWNRRRYDD